jgi:hypothetical protein
MIEGAVKLVSTMKISPKVAAAIDKFFATTERAPVTELLAQYGDAAHEREAERIHLLILKMSRRDLARVSNLVKAAKRDYRDVIAWAAQPTRRYVVGLLQLGPAAIAGKFTILQTSSIQKWKREDSIVVGGLSPGDDVLRGVYIFKLDSIEAAEALVAADPAIQSGELRFEFHSWLAPAGLQVGVPHDYLDIDIH